MNALRIEADESSSKAEEYKARVKTLEAENTQKEQEITSLSHKNQVLESEVEKLETSVKTYKDEAAGGAASSTQAESLQRKIQVLEEEAEESDRTIRELNEKYVSLSFAYPSRRMSRQQPVDLEFHILTTRLGSVKPTSSPATTNAKCKPSSRPATSGKPSTRRWPRNTRTPRRSSTTLSRRLVTFDQHIVGLAWWLTLI
jgi:cell division protein FtsB